MSDWLPAKPVVKPSSKAAWKVKRNGRTVPQEALDAEKKRSKAGRTQLTSHEQAELHARGEPCRVPICTLPICVAARDSTSNAQHRPKPAPPKSTQTRSASLATARQRRIELHAKGLPCGQPRCKKPACKQPKVTKPARKPSKSRAKAMAKAKQTRRSFAPVLHAKALPMGPTGKKSGTELALERAQAKHRKQQAHPEATEAAAARSGVAESGAAKSGTTKSGTISTTRAAVGPHDDGTATDESASTPKKKATPASRQRSVPKSPTKKRKPETKQCRECLKIKPLSEFPNQRISRCEACGVRPPSRSVRTVSGGAPGLGKRA